MSHTFEFRPAWLNPQDRGTVFFHNGDFSGEVTAVVDASCVEPGGRASDGESYVHATLQFDAIEALVAEKVRLKLIEQAEQASPEWLLYRSER